MISDPEVAYAEGFIAFNLGKPEKKYAGFPRLEKAWESGYRAGAEQLFKTLNVITQGNKLMEEAFLK